MAWKIMFATEGDTEKSVSLDDLSPDVFDEIAKDDPDGNWWSVYTFPGANYARMYRVISAAAKHLGVDPPERAATMRDSERLIEMLQPAEDIGDKSFVDGFPPVPEETETGSSSISSGDTTGRSASLEESQPETS